MIRTITADLSVDSRGGLRIEEGIEAVRQRVLQRLRFTRGEWFLSERDGVPYADAIFNQGLDAGLAAQVIAGELLRLDVVKSVEVVAASLSPITRRLRVAFRVETNLGEVFVEEEF